MISARPIQVFYTNGRAGSQIAQANWSGQQGSRLKQIIDLLEAELKSSLSFAGNFRGLEPSESITIYL